MKPPLLRRGHSHKNFISNDDTFVPWYEGTNEDMDSLFGIAMPMLHGFNFQKCNNNHLVSSIKVEGLFVSYIVPS